METKILLNQLLKERKITQQQYKTYIGQIKHGDEIPCIIGMVRKGFLNKNTGDRMIDQIKMAYTE